MLRTSGMTVAFLNTCNSPTSESGTFLSSNNQQNLSKIRTVKADEYMLFKKFRQQGSWRKAYRDIFTASF